MDAKEKHPLFPTAQEVDKGVAILRQGITDPFWQLLVKAMKLEIKMLEAEILDGGLQGKPRQALEDRRLKMKELLTLPDKLIKLFAPAESKSEELEDDPYHTPESLFEKDSTLDEEG